MSPNVRGLKRRCARSLFRADPPDLLACGPEPVASRAAVQVKTTDDLRTQDFKMQLVQDDTLKKNQNRSISARERPSIST